jgi:aspartate kinase
MFSLKFGGTSMGNAESITQVADIIINHKEKDKIVTVSAISGVTNMLIQSTECISKNNSNCYKSILIDIEKRHIEILLKLVKNKKLYKEGETFIKNRIQKLSEFLNALLIVKEISECSNDAIISVGEILSAYLLSVHLQDRGILSKFINLENTVDQKYNIKDINNEFFNFYTKSIGNLLIPLLEKNIIPVCTGFFGQIPGGIIKSLGRGYTDFTASLIGKACKAKEIQIWTDVSGVFSTDPNIVSNAHVLPELSFSEATELANFGAKIIHPQTIWPAVKNNILVRIKNTHSPQDKGTVITKKGKLTNNPFKSITIKKNITLINISSSKMKEIAIMSKLFQCFEKYKISIDLISTSESSISITILGDYEKMPIFVSELENTFLVRVEKNQAIISIVGNEMIHSIGIAGRFFSVLGNENINLKMISQGSGESNISAVILEEDIKKAIRVVHKEFFKI